jgi:hypothetical protein
MAENQQVVGVPDLSLSELAHISLRHLGLHVSPPAHPLVRQEGPKMTNESKDTKPITDVENKKTPLTEEELTERELDKVSGGLIEPVKIEFPNLTLVTKDAARA